jgi:hypothetical protein
MALTRSSSDIRTVLTRSVIHPRRRSIHRWRPKASSDAASPRTLKPQLPRRIAGRKLTWMNGRGLWRRSLHGSPAGGARTPPALSCLHWQ